MPVWRWPGLRGRGLYWAGSALLPVPLAQGRVSHPASLYHLHPPPRAGGSEGDEISILQAAGAADIQASQLRLTAHQIGTHRMGRDPRASVVDASLRAHDVPNLYLVGSGSFVTASSSPPTLTIVALAIRAAEHIAARLRAG